jgi:Tfp pilus assembly protein PilF
MNIGQRSSRRPGRLVRSLTVAGVLLAFGAIACGGSGSNNAGTTVKPNAKLATKALSSGLKAYSAGNLNAAATAYHLTLKYDKTNKYAFYNLALIDAANGNYGLAEGNYRSALKTDPKFDPALFNLGILRTARNDPKEAMALYQRAVASDKTDAAAWLNLGLLLRANGHMRAGDKDVLRAIALNPKLTDPAKAKGTGTAPPASTTTSP